MYRLPLLAFLIAVVGLAAGCNGDGLGAKPAAPVAGAEPRNPQPADAQARTAVEEALEWSHKYAESAEKYNLLLEENKKLMGENQKLQEQAVLLRSELSVAQSELTKTNTMVVEMRGELTKWQSNVLGFRKEMIDAQQVELVALNRILKLLAGEPVTAPSAASAPAAAPPAKEPASAISH